MSDDLSPEFITRAKAAITRLELIRDFFLEGRDAEAVQLLREEDPAVDYRVIGFQSDSYVLPAQAVQIVARLQYEFRGRYFMVSRRSLDFQIEDIKVGNQSMFVRHGAIAADLFAGPDNEDTYVTGDPEDPRILRVSAQARTRIGLPIDMTWCEVAQDLSIVVTNIGRINALFSGAILGEIRRR